MEVFALGTDGAVWHIWQTEPSAGPWSDWHSLVGPNGGGLRGGIAVMPNYKKGRLEVFALGGWGDLRHTWKDISTGSWVWH